MSHRLAGARCRAMEDPEDVLRKTVAWAQARGADVLLADARIVFGPDHLESAALHAERAKAAGTMVARAVALEALRYLAGRRQVADAISVAGIRKGTERVAVLAFGDVPLDDLVTSMGWNRDDSVLGAQGKDLAELGISKKERDTVGPKKAEDLALERLALVDVER